MPSTRGTRNGARVRVRVCGCVHVCLWVTLFMMWRLNNKPNGNEVTIYGRVDLLDNFMNNDQKNRFHMYAILYSLTGIIFFQTTMISFAHMIHVATFQAIGLFQVLNICEESNHYVTYFDSVHTID